MSLRPLVRRREAEARVRRDRPSRTTYKAARPGHTATPQPPGVDPAGSPASCARPYKGRGASLGAVLDRNAYWNRRSMHRKPASRTVFHIWNNRSDPGTDPEAP